MSTQSLDSLESCTQALRDVPSLTELCKLRQRKSGKRCSHTGSPIAEHDNSYLFQTESAISSAGNHLVSGDTQPDPGSPSVLDSIPSTVVQDSDTAPVAAQIDEYFVAYQARPLYGNVKSVWHLVFDTVVLLWGYGLHFILTAWPYTCWLIVAGALYFSVLRPIVVVICTSVVLPRCPYNLSFLRVIDALIYAAWRRIASYKVTYHRDIQKEPQYIMAEFPHGVYPLAGQLHATSWVNYHSSQLSMLAADVLFWLPGWKHYMSCGGVVPATPKIVESELRIGRSLGVHVGGIAEMFEAQPDKETIHLSRRRGFVRFALQALQKLSRKLRVSMGIFVGQFGLPLPRWRPLWTVAGAPLDMGPGLSPSAPGFDALVEQKHAAFTSALQELYEKHKGQYFDGNQSWAERPLIIL